MRALSFAQTARRSVGLTEEAVQAARLKLQTNPEILAKIPKQKHPHHRLSVLGAPFHFGQPITGVEQGPRLLRECNLLPRLEDLGWQVKDIGDTEMVAPHDSQPTLNPTIGRAKNSFAVGKSMQNIYSHAQRVFAEDDFLLLMGGDHSVAIGSVAAALQRDPATGVIWVDAHADLNTPATSPSGNMHGMPLSFMFPGLVETGSMPGFEWMGPANTMDPSQLVYIGLRDVDAGEVQMIRQMGILAFTMHDIDRLGIGVVMEIVFSHLKETNNGVARNLHLSFDIDAIDPMICPATGTKVPGGLTYREAHFVAESISLSGKLRSMDIVEVNHKLSDKHGVEETVKVAAEIVLSALGKNIV